MFSSEGGWRGPKTLNPAINFKKNLNFDQDTLKNSVSKLRHWNFMPKIQSLTSDSETLGLRLGLEI